MTTKPIEEQLLVRVEIAAQMLSLGRSSIYELMDKGEIRFVKWGKARRVIVTSLHAFIAKHSQVR